jgi:hypothetical protein
VQNFRQEIKQAVQFFADFLHPLAGDAHQRPAGRLAMASNTRAAGADISPPTRMSRARQLNLPMRQELSIGPSAGSSSRESTASRLPPTNISLRLSYRENAQRSPRAARPELSQSTTTSPLSFCRWNSCRCRYSEPPNACTGSGANTSTDSLPREAFKVCPHGSKPGLRYILVEAWVLK